MSTLRYLGRGSLKFKTDVGNVVYVDPFMGDDAWYAEPADPVLVTHQHYDHAAIDKMPMRQNAWRGRTWTRIRIRRHI